VVPLDVLFVRVFATRLVVARCDGPSNIFSRLLEHPSAGHVTWVNRNVPVGCVRSYLTFVNVEESHLSRFDARNRRVQQFPATVSRTSSPT